MHLKDLHFFIMMLIFYFKQKRLLKDVKHCSKILWKR